MTVPDAEEAGMEVAAARIDSNHYILDMLFLIIILDMLHARGQTAGCGRLLDKPSKEPMRTMRARPPQADTTGQRKSSS